MNKYALITGASSGIGKSLALQLAARGYQLLLTSRSEDKLKELADLIRNEYGMDAQYYAVDLSKESAPARLSSWCTSLSISPDILINNAGYGLWGNFDNLGLDEQVNMHRLNTEAVIRLTYGILPLLKQHKKSYILNISSTAAYQPVPTLAIYAAGKSFVLSFSRALRFELKDSQVSVSCLCPGPTATGFAHRAGLDALAKLAEKFNMSPDRVAKDGINGLLKGKSEIIPGFLNRLSAFGARHAPDALVDWVTSRLYKA